MTHPPRPPDPRVALALLLVACAWLLPGLDRPFGAKEQNPGAYFGVFVNNYERFGFAATRGVPLGVTGLEEVEQGLPYLTHPPGLSWLLWSFGTAEWQLRLPTVLCSIASALLLWLLARRALGDGGGVLAAVLFLAAPVTAFHGQVSYEPAVMVCGLGLLLGVRCAIERRARGAPAWSAAAAIAACGLFGPWFDWAFAFFCAALVPYALERGPRTLVTAARRLAWPALAAVSGLAAVLGWFAWAAGGPWPRPESGGLLELVHACVFDRPEWSAFAAGAGSMLVRGHTWPLLAAAVAGAWILWRRDRRLTAALLLAGAPNALLFANHSINHEIYYAYLTPLVAVAAAAAVSAVAPGSGGRARAIRIAGGLALAAVAAADTIGVRERTSTAFYRDFGRALTAASHGDVDGEGRYVVGHGFLWFYGYYVDAPSVFHYPTRDARAIRDFVAGVVDGTGVRYVWLRVSGSVADASPALRDSPELVAYLGSRPRRRLPELESSFDLNGRGAVVTIDEAWLVTLKEP